MEFFRTLNIALSPESIEENINLSNLESWSNNLFPIADVFSDSANIGGIWGEFTLELQKINGGLRFSLKECPNALTFTLTSGHPPNAEGMVVHLTVNRVTICSEFENEIIDFLDDMVEQISNVSLTNTKN
jgi:hypothetical protein